MQEELLVKFLLGGGAGSYGIWVLIILAAHRAFGMLEARGKRLHVQSEQTAKREYQEHQEDESAEWTRMRDLLGELRHQAEGHRRAHDSLSERFETFKTSSELRHQDTERRHRECEDDRRRLRIDMMQLLSHRNSDSTIGGSADGGEPAV